MQFLTLYNIGRLERKLRRRERAAIGKPKLPTPLRSTIKSRRKIKASSIDGSKEESEGSFVLGKGKKKGKKYRTMPEIVKTYQAKNVQALGGRITVRFKERYYNRSLLIAVEGQTRPEARFFGPWKSIITY